jgi:hypothetical protein
MATTSTDRRQGLNSGAAVKVPCKAATTANITLTGEQTVDGVALVTGDRCLVKDQTTGSGNGIYTVDTGAWTRAKDWDGSYDVKEGTFVYVTDGSTNTGFWYVTTADPITIGTTSVALARASSVLAAVTAYIQTLLDDVDAPAARSTLGVALANKGGLLAGTGANAVAEKAVGTDGYKLHAQPGATDGLQYLPPEAGYTLLNGYLDWSVAGNVLTVAVKTWAGTDPSATDPVYIAFRSATPGTGSLTLRKLTAATSIAINITATLGTSNSEAFRLWAVAFDDGGTVRLGLINCRSGTNVFPLAGWGIDSSTQESDASDSAHVFYTDGAAVAAKAYATLGYATWETGLATAGTWSAAPTRVQLFGPSVPLPGHVVQVQRTQTGAVATGTTTIPFDDTIPQNTEGDQYMSQPITPRSAANVLRTDVNGFWSSSAAVRLSAALFQDSTANALAAGSNSINATTDDRPIAFRHDMLAATTSATTLKVRAGGSGAGTTTFNGISAGRIFGGVYASSLNIAEVMA